MMKVNEVYEGDCLDVMREFPDNCIDSIITDPPYGLQFMGKDWDYGLPGAPYWREALRVAKPGATLLAFGGSRTYHRLTCAIEDAGWEIRDCIMWVYGSGFPKSTDISKQLDKVAIVDCQYCNGSGKGRLNYMIFCPEHGEIVGDNDLCPVCDGEVEEIELEREPCKYCGGSGKVKGAKREVVGPKLGPNGQLYSTLRQMNPGTMHEGYNRPWKQDKKKININNMETTPATPLAKQWDGWGTALKPSYEPIVIAQKPIDQNYAHNAERWGIAGLNIDECRITPSSVYPSKSIQLSSIPDDALSCVHLFLRDFYDYILSNAHCYNIDGTSLKRNVVDLGDKLPAAFLCEPCLNRHSANDGVCDRNLSSTQDFRSDCLICHHFCDELSRLLLKDALDVQTLRNDVLRCIHSSLCWDDLGEVSRDSLNSLCIDHLSNCDDVHVFLSRLYSLLKSISNYTTLSTNPQSVDFIPEIRNKVYGKGLGGKNPNGYPKGRWPANVIHDSSEEVMAEFDKAGVRKNHGGGTIHRNESTTHLAGLGPKIPDQRFTGDSGSAARFFAQCPPDPTAHPEAARFHYCPKAGKRERMVGASEKIFKMRNDLTDDEKDFVMAELKKIGLV
jgi:hypothetical protein